MIFFHNQSEEFVGWQAPFLFYISLKEKQLWQTI